IINNFITTSSVLIRKDVFKDSGGFDESLSALEDWKLWASLSKMYYLKYQETPLMKYRVYNFSTSRNARKILPIHCKVIGHIFDTICTTDPLYKYRKEALSESYFICSYIAEESSDFSFSFFCSLRSYYFQPLKFKAFKRVLSSFKNLITSNFK
ncbi:MAG: glycosyltransferase family 2 protein, partial [Thalassotalea sp.]|nr:glycosyltransferase family 2 protein [Thalassotalea sp.]